MSSPVKDAGSAQRSLIFWILSLFFLVAAISAATELWLATQNNLGNNGRWTVTKRHLARLVMGSEQYFRGSQALARNRLNLGGWHGFQEVLFGESLRLAEVGFSFKLSEGAYLVFLFKDVGTEWNGFRLSAHPRFKNAWFQIPESGFFKLKRPLLVPSPEVERWHTVQLDFRGPVPRLRVNGGDSIQLPAVEGKVTRFGFRAGHYNAAVDDLRIMTPSGDQVVETFDNRKGWWPAFGVMTGGGFATQLILLLYLGIGRFKFDSRYFLLFNMLFTFILATGLLYYTYLEAHRYPAPWPEWVITIKEGLGLSWVREENWIAQETERISQEIEKRHDLRPAPETYRTLFIGTSQTWGAGASRAGEGFVAVLSGLLERRYPERRFELINAAVSGQKSRELFRLYESRWIRYKPALTLINLSNNDGDPETFESSLRRFLKLNREQQIETIFLLEPNTLERQDETTASQRTMQRVAKEEKIPLVNLQQYLNDRADDGFLWWDLVHPTSAGHYLIAECLLAFLEPELTLEAAAVR